jgi:hypothetical protein
MEKLNQVSEAISDINTFSQLEKLVIQNPDAIVGVVEGINGAASAPVWGYEVQFAKQQEAEIRVMKVKTQYESLMADFGIKVSSANKNVIRRAKKKIRLSKEDRELRLLSGGNKSWAKSIKADIKSAKKNLALVAGTPAAQVYLDEIKMYEQQLAQLAA